MPSEKTIDNNQLCTALHTLGILVPTGFLGAAVTHFILPRSALLSTAIPGVIFPALSYIPAIASYQARTSSARLTAGRLLTAGTVVLGSSLVLSDIDDKEVRAEAGLWIYAVGSTAIWLLGLDREQGCLQNLFTVSSAANDFISIGVLGSSLNNHIPLALALALTAAPNALCALLSLGMVLYSFLKSEEKGLSNSLKVVQSILALLAIVGAVLMLTDLSNMQGRAEVGVWSVAVCMGALRTLPVPGKHSARQANENRAPLLETQERPGLLPARG